MFMLPNKSLIYLLLLFVSTVSSNLCPDSPSCTCTLTAGIHLDIVCSGILSPSELPTLNNATLQAGITSLRVASTGGSGPLTTLPTNLCSIYPNVAILDLSSNAIEGFLDTSQLACLGSNLLQVDLSNNLINETDTNLFYANRQLITIDLSYNRLQTMPTIDGEYFLNFISTLISMDFSYNQIVSVDLWPLFVKTRKYMSIDMSHNSITSFTNTVPVYVKQFTETPDPRAFYLNNNQISSLSDLLVQRYGACSTIGYDATSYFIVGISNLLLTENPLACDCESYNLRKFINDRLDDFPLIANGSALLNQARCASPSIFNGQLYLSMNITPTNSCRNYTLPSISDAFCSVYTNVSSSTIAPPTYWLTTTTLLTTIIDGNVTNPGSGGSTNSNSEEGNSTSSSPAWYIILGIVLGLIVLLVLLGIGGFLCRDRLLPKKCRSKFRKNVHNLNSSYKRMGRHSGLSSQNEYPLNGIRPVGTSRSISSDSPHYWNDDVHPDQETQTCFQVDRSRPPANSRPPPSRNPQRLTNNDKNNNNTAKINNKKNDENESDGRKPPPPTSKIPGHGVKGIPIASLANKKSDSSSNGKNSPADTNTCDLNITSIPLTPSKRAKLLPPLKGGIYVDSNNHNLLNISAGAIPTHQRQRRLSSSWTRRAQQNFLPPLSHRPQSMTTQKSAFTQEDTSDEEILSIPTVESSINKPSKPLRALPLLNITVVPAWIDNEK